MNFAFYFCVDFDKDPVARSVFDTCMALHRCDDAGFLIDSMPVYVHTSSSGHDYFFVRTQEVLSHDLARYLGDLNTRFSGTNLVGNVNWHEGRNAPDQIFCVHTWGDVTSGHFGAASPPLTTAIVSAMEYTRGQSELGEWQSLPEATHFSGMLHGVSASLITQCIPPVVDIEIGSTVASWTDVAAIKALARSLVLVGDFVNAAAMSILFVGGRHFEPTVHFATTRGSAPVNFSHVLPNQWVTGCGYEGETGVGNLRRAVQSIAGGVDAIVFHDGLKSPVKEVVRRVGIELGIPVVKHRQLRDGHLGFGSGLSEST